MTEKDCGLLIGRQKICEFLKIGKNEFYDFIYAGAPIIKFGKNNRRWMAHCDALDCWGRDLTENKGKEK